MFIEEPGCPLLTGESLISLWSSSRPADSNPVELIFSVLPDLELSILERLNILDIRCLFDGCSIDPSARVHVGCEVQYEDGGVFDEGYFRL